MVSVYLIKAGGTNNYKIGISNDTNNRLNSLQTAHYEKLSIVHERAYTNRFMALIVEEELHSKYKKNNIMGEWFLLDPIHIKDIIEILNKNISEVLSLKARVRELEEEIKKVPLQKNKIDTLSSGKNIDKDALMQKIFSSIEKIGDKLPSKKTLIDISKRNETKLYESVMKHLLKNGIVELKRGYGYYLIMDKDEALKVVGGAK